MAKVSVALLLSFALLGAHSQDSQDGRVVGLYSDLRELEEGDIGGAEILLSLAFVRGGEDIEYYAYVQLAEGVPDVPQLVKANVDGQRVTFSLAGKYAAMSPFRGEVRGDTLVGSFANGWELRLARRASFWN